MDLGNFFEEKIISNHVVTDVLFRYLTKSELLDCTLISKKWVSPCRKFLLQHHECLLRLEPNELDSAVELLDNSKEIFYNGVYWDLTEVWGDEEELEKVSKIVEPMFGKLPTKLRFATIISSGCKLVQYYLNIHEVDALEKLKIEVDADLDLTEMFGPDLNFPNLKVLCIKSYPTFPVSLECEDFLQRLPVLQEWSSSITAGQISDFAAANKVHAIKKIKIQNYIPPGEVDAIEAGNVALKKLEYCIELVTVEHVQIFLRIIAKSVSSLQKVILNYKFYKMLITVPGIPPLNNVKKLIITPERYYQLSEVPDMKRQVHLNSNTPRIFPNAEIIFREDEDEDGWND